MIYILFILINQGVGIHGWNYYLIYLDMECISGQEYTYIFVYKLSWEHADNTQIRLYIKKGLNLYNI